jgi:hypothetical protein
MWVANVSDAPTTATFRIEDIYILKDFHHDRSIHSRKNFYKAKLSLYLTNKHYAMKAYRRVDIFLSSALDGSEWSASRSGRFTPGTHWIGDWVAPRARLDAVEKRKFLTLPGLQLRPVGRPARSQQLYRL